MAQRQPTNRAALAVFGIAELFDRILLETTFRDLFIIQRVSKQWQDFISSSKPLQKRMFLLADGEPVSPVWLSPNTTPAVKHTLYAARTLKLNPLLKLQDSNDYFDPVPMGHGSNFDPQYLGNIKLDGKTWRYWNRSVIVASIHESFSDLRALNRERLRGRMFLTQPPITVMDAQCYGYQDRDNRVEQKKVQNATGITLGQMYPPGGTDGDSFNRHFRWELMLEGRDGARGEYI